MNFGALEFELLDQDAVEQIFAIEERVHLSPWSKAKVTGYFDNPLSQVLGCFLQQNVIAYAFIQVIEPEAELQNLAVSELFQGCGLGAYFLQGLIQHCKNLGLEKILLEVRESNQRAINLYQANGFKQVGRRLNYYQMAGGREAALLLTLQLN